MHDWANPEKGVDLTQNFAMSLDKQWNYNYYWSTETTSLQIVSNWKFIKHFLIYKDTFSFYTRTQSVYKDMLF
jgi:hypothetical protein